MKKKVLSVALVVALIAIMVSGTLAYFTAEDKVTNTFTIGSVLIEVWENNAPTDSDKVVFEKPLLPVVDMENLTDDPGYAAKVVKVENTGKNAAYIRVHIAQPVELLGYLELEIDETTGWKRVYTTGMKQGTQEYIVATYDFLSAVDANEFTTELLKGAYLAADVDLAENADGNLVFVKKTNGQITHNSGFVAHTKNANGTYTSASVNILVAAEAIQAQGFDDATTALDTGFGQGKNPWQAN